MMSARERYLKLSLGAVSCTFLLACLLGVMELAVAPSTARVAMPVTVLAVAWLSAAGLAAALSERRWRVTSFLPLLGPFVVPLTMGESGLAGATLLLLIGGVLGLLVLSLVFIAMVTLRRESDFPATADEVAVQRWQQEQHRRTRIDEIKGAVLRVLRDVRLEQQQVHTDWKAEGNEPLVSEGTIRLRLSRAHLVPEVDVMQTCLHDVEKRTSGGVLMRCWLLRAGCHCRGRGHVQPAR
jgi:hypothetical protein